MALCAASGDKGIRVIGTSQQQHLLLLVLDKCCKRTAKICWASLHASLAVRLTSSPVILLCIRELHAIKGHTCMRGLSTSSKRTWDAMAVSGRQTPGPNVKLRLSSNRIAVDDIACCTSCALLAVASCRGCRKARHFATSKLRARIVTLGARAAVL